MARPRKEDRSSLADLTLTIRLTPEDRSLLDSLVQRRSVELESEGGGTITAASFVRFLIRREAKNAGISEGEGTTKAKRKVSR